MAEKVFFVCFLDNYEIKRIFLPSWSRLVRFVVCEAADNR